MFASTMQTSTYILKHNISQNWLILTKSIEMQVFHEVSRLIGQEILLLHFANSSQFE